MYITDRVQYNSTTVVQATQQCTAVLSVQVLTEHTVAPRQISLGRYLYWFNHKTHVQRKRSLERRHLRTVHRELGGNDPIPCLIVHRLKQSFHSRNTTQASVSPRHCSRCKLLFYRVTIWKMTLLSHAVQDFPAVHNCRVMDRS